MDRFSRRAASAILTPELSLQPLEIFYFSFNVYGCFTYVEVCLKCLRAEEGVVSPGAGVTDGCEQPRWESNLGPVEKYSGLLTSTISPAPFNKIVLYLIFQPNSFVIPILAKTSHVVGGRQWNLGFNFGAFLRT